VTTYRDQYLLLHRKLETYLSEDSCELSLIGVSWGSYDPLKGDRHILGGNVEAIITSESLKRGNDITMLKVSEHVERRLSIRFREYSNVNELNRGHLPNSHFHGAAEFNVIDLIVPYPRRPPCCSQLEGATCRKSNSS
jgi:hypothetical protein